MNEEEYFEACNGNHKYFCINCGVELDIDERFCGKECRSEYLEDEKFLPKLELGDNKIYMLNRTSNDEIYNFEKIDSISTLRTRLKFILLYMLFGLVIILIWVSIKFELIPIEWLPGV